MIGVATAPAAGSAPVLCGALPARGGCYDIRVAGSGVCREPRDGACVVYAEEVTDRKKEPTRVKEGSTGCTIGSSSTDHCASNKCDVTIGGKTYCSQCATGYVPIDGTCVEKSGQETKCTTNNNGACTQCQAGYFKNPVENIDATHQSCITCNDTTGDGTNKGKLGCATCEAPSSSGAATCKTCMEGFFGDASCTQCTDTNCAKCAQAGSAQCTECKATGNEIHLKKEGASATGTCVAKADCSGANFPAVEKSTGKSICTPCSDATNGGIDGCKTCSKTGDALKCLTCSDPKKPSTDGTKCVTCTVTNCATCSADNVCEVCTDGYRKNGGNYEKCTLENCKACASDASTCTECVEGYTLEGGKCVSSSTNKSGLSTGAIAGISVAALVVVGGLVGFLCWWFICRGKA